MTICTVCCAPLDDDLGLLLCEHCTVVAPETVPRHDSLSLTDRLIAESADDTVAALFASWSGP